MPIYKVICTTSVVYNLLQYPTFSGGWSVINVPGDGTVWGLNSDQFIREKRLGSEAFYGLVIDVDDAFSNFILKVWLIIIAAKIFTQLQMHAKMSNCS